MKKKKTHPFYPNSTIIEVIIEIYLATPLKIEDLAFWVKNLIKSYEYKKDNVQIFYSCDS